MKSASSTDLSLAEITRSNGEPINKLAFAKDLHERRARKAAITHKEWKQTGCQYLMTFEQFRQQSVRNKIRRDLNLQPIILRGESNPASQRPAKKRAKANHVRKARRHSTYGKTNRWHRHPHA